MEDQLETLGTVAAFEGSSEEEPGTGLVDFLYPAPAPRNTLGIVKWWEARRFKFNAIVGGTGLLSLGLFHGLLSLPPDPVHLSFTPIPILMFGLLANIFYLIGPTVELAIEKLSGGKILPTGPALFRMGLTFSIGLTFLPTLLGGINWVLRLLGLVF